MNATRSLLRPAYRVAIKEHVVDRWTVPAATFKLCAPDETAAGLMATRAAHRRAGVPPMKGRLPSGRRAHQGDPDRAARMTMAELDRCRGPLAQERAEGTRGAPGETPLAPRRDTYTSMCPTSQQAARSEPQQSMPRDAGDPDRAARMTMAELIEVAQGRWLAVDCCTAGDLEDAQRRRRGEPSQTPPWRRDGSLPGVSRRLPTPGSARAPADDSLERVGTPIRPCRSRPGRATPAESWPHAKASPISRSSRS